MFIDGSKIRFLVYLVQYCFTRKDLRPKFFSKLNFVQALSLKLWVSFASHKYSSANWQYLTGLIVSYFVSFFVALKKKKNTGANFCL